MRGKPLILLSLTAIVGLPLLAADPSYADPIAPVNLRTAGNFAILSQAGITTTGVTAIVGDMGVSPIGSTAVTGFSLIMDGGGSFSTSFAVVGKVYAANYASPTPSYLGTAIGDMGTAYSDAAGRSPGLGLTDLNSGNIGGLILAPDVYRWGSSVTITDDLTLDGPANAVWIFQIAGTLEISAGKSVILIGGAQADNIFWQVAGATTLFGSSAFKGTILGATGIAMQDGATLDGRALAGTSVTLIGNTIVNPVAEPGTLSLLALGGLAMLRRRRGVIHGIGDARFPKSSGIAWCLSWFYECSFCRL